MIEFVATWEEKPSLLWWFLNFVPHEIIFHSLWVYIKTWTCRMLVLETLQSMVDWGLLDPWCHDWWWGFFLGFDIGMLNHWNIRLLLLFTWILTLRVCSALFCHFLFGLPNCHFEFSGNSLWLRSGWLSFYWNVGF